jgi:hypothetical protein
MDLCCRFNPLNNYQIVNLKGEIEAIASICILHFEICNPIPLRASVSLRFQLSVHSSTVKIGFRSANRERNPIPSKRWCESVVKVFLTKTLRFTRFGARALTVFFAEKNSRSVRAAKNLGIYRPNEMQQPRAV